MILISAEHCKEEKNTVYLDLLSSCRKIGRFRAKNVTFPLDSMWGVGGNCFEYWIDVFSRQYLLLFYFVLSQ